MFLRIELCDSGRRILVNTDHISSMWQSGDQEKDSYTTIEMVNGNIRAKETIEDIYNQIRSAI